MTYFNGWHKGSLVKMEDWYRDDLIYVNIRSYCGSTAVSRPDKEQSFLIQTNDSEFFKMYIYSVIEALMCREEVRDDSGKLVPIKITLPDRMLLAAHHH